MTIKLFAILFMTIDHIGVYFAPALPANVTIILRLLGRIAFPLFAYSTAISFRRTRNFFRYALRLFAAAWISQLVIAYAKSLVQQRPVPNVLFTLTLGVVFITAYELFTRGNYDKLVRMQPLEEGADNPQAQPWQFRFNEGFAMVPWLAKLLGVLFMALALFCASYFETDYGIYGVLNVFAFHLALKQTEEEQYGHSLMLLGNLNLIFIVISDLAMVNFRFLTPVFRISPRQGFSVLAVPLIYALQRASNRPDQKPGPVAKWFFYFYYPLHILLLAWLAHNLLY
ncbi:MAG: TraX family protein [Eubacteriales bacterium]|nr:TraX family protein [Eubacteriales bacterium]